MFFFIHKALHNRAATYNTWRLSKNLNSCNNNKKSSTMFTSVSGLILLEAYISPIKYAIWYWYNTVLNVETDVKEFFHKHSSQWVSQQWETFQNTKGSLGCFPSSFLSEPSWPGHQLRWPKWMINSAQVDDQVSPVDDQVGQWEKHIKIVVKIL